MDAPRTCDVCGLFVHEPHPVTVHIDGRNVVRLNVCIEHREKLRDLIADAAQPQQRAA